MNINGIEVTDVIVYPVRRKPEGSSVMAFAKIVLNDQFVINGLRIIEGKYGPFIAFPREYSKASGKNCDIAFPVTVELRDYIADRVLTQFKIAEVACSD